MLESLVRANYQLLNSARKKLKEKIDVEFHLSYYKVYSSMQNSSDKESLYVFVNMHRLTL